jgi:HK97 family phage major capsid protein
MFKTPEELAEEIVTGINQKTATLTARVDELEQKADRIGGGGDFGGKSWGAQVADSDAVKALAEVKKTQPGRVRIEVKDITTGPTSAGALIPPMRDGSVNMIAGREPRLRDLLTVINTASGSVEYVDQTTRDNNAAPVAEGTLKPQSEYEFELKNLPIRTIAHWTKASVQVLDDAPQLQSIIDNELRYGLALAEEAQLLNGDGVSPNLDGLITNATAYAAAFAPDSPTMIDKIGLGMLQVANAYYQPNGIVIHPSDWMRMRLLKDADGNYLLGNPQAAAEPRLFGLPVVATTAMAIDKFLIGDFRRAATLYDRQEATVALSTEDGDNFVKNMVTIRCEARLGLALKNAEALSYGDFGNVA